MATSDMGPHVARAVEAFEEHDVDGLMAQFADGGTFVDPLVPDGVGGEEFSEYMADTFEAFPDIDVEVERVLTDDDGGTALVCTYTGTHTGSMEGVPPTGNAFAVPGVSIVTVSDDGITSWRDYWNEQAFAEQLGLTFPAIVPKLPGIAVGKLRDVV